MKKEVTIGRQEWMAENLNVDKFRNGDPILEAKTDEEWEKAGENGQPAWCYYEYDPANGTKYGKLYNWFAVNDPRGLAPEGWHVPGDKEWEKLVKYLGGDLEAGKRMKASHGWENNGNGTEEGGFSGLPGGSQCDYGTFEGIGRTGVWWSSTEHTPTNACNRLLYYNHGHAQIRNSSKGEGYSVRCLRD